MTLIGEYKKFKMWRTADRLIEFWKNDKAQSKIARIITLTADEREAIRYFDKLEKNDALHTFYS